MIQSKTLRPTPTDSRPKDVPASITVLYEEGQRQKPKQREGEKERERERGGERERGAPTKKASDLGQAGKRTCSMAPSIHPKLAVLLDISVANPRFPPTDSARHVS